MTGHSMLALETKRHAALADFHKAHVDQAHVAAPAEHRKAYVAERGEQAKALKTRDRMYGMQDIKSADEALEAARVREQKRDVLSELSDLAERGGRVRATIAKTHEQMRDVGAELAAAKKVLATAGERIDEADDNELAAIGEAHPLLGNVGKSARQIARARDGVDDASTLKRDTVHGFDEACAHVARLEAGTKALAARDKQLQAELSEAEADSVAARDVLASVLRNAGGSPARAAAAARDEADLTAASQGVTLDKLEASKPSAPSVRAEIARQRGGLGGYYARAAEGERARKGAAMDGYVDQAHEQLGRADALRVTLPAGSTRDALALQAIDVRASLTETEVDKRPEDATADLRVAEKSAGEIQSGVAAFGTTITTRSSSPVTWTPSIHAPSSRPSPRSPSSSRRSDRWIAGVRRRPSTTSSPSPRAIMILSAGRAPSAAPGTVTSSLADGSTTARGSCGADRTTPRSSSSTISRCRPTRRSSKPSRPTRAWDKRAARIASTPAAF